MRSVPPRLVAPALSLSFAVILLLARAHAGPAPALLGPWLQDPRPDGALITFETDPPTPAEIIVELEDGERRFTSPAILHHEVRVSDLPPGRHRFRLVAGESTSSGLLPTRPTAPRFDFLVYGDNRDRDADHARVVHAMLSEGADFALHTGDMTGDGGRLAEWRTFFRIETPLLATLPIYPTLGNHEYGHDPIAANYHHFFTPPIAPDGNTPDRAASHYQFRIANSVFIALDANKSRDRAQAIFLEKALTAAGADPTIDHTFVFFHQPPFAAGDYCGYGVEQALWVPEFKAHHVRAVFTGHDHAYEHLERDGVRYFIAGGGGAPLQRQSAHCPPYDRAALRLFRSTHHYLRVHIAGPTATLQSIAADGTPIETVNLSDPVPVAAAPPVPWPDAPTHPGLSEMAATMTASATGAAKSGDSHAWEWIGAVIAVGVMLVAGGLGVKWWWGRNGDGGG